MHSKKLCELPAEELADIIECVMEDMKMSGMATYYNKYKEKIDDKIYHISKDKAHEIVRRMKPYGEMFTMDTVKNMTTGNGIPYDDNTCIKYYLCMNMYANDAKQVAEENNMSVEKFCFVMAKSFINDMDGGKHKVEKYFTEVAGE